MMMGSPKSTCNGLIRRRIFYIVAATSLWLLAACSHRHTFVPFSSPPDHSFYSALKIYLEHPPQKRDHVLLEPFFSEFAISEFDELIEKFGSSAVKQAIEWYPKKRLEELLRFHGDDFFIVVLHTTISTHSYLAVVDKQFGIDSQLLVDSIIKNKGRFIGAFVIFETIDMTQFEAITDTFADTLPIEVFLQSFYNDPYLLATAIRIFSKRDPEAQELKKFIAYFPDRQTRADLFLNNLPGLVVAFSTIHEIRSGKEMLWVKAFLDVTDQQLATLIYQKPVDLAYVLYGGYRIGIDNFKHIINSLGKEHFRIALMKHTAWLADFMTGLKKISFLSSDADFQEIDTILATIKSRYSFLLQHNLGSPFHRERVLELFRTLPTAKTFLSSKDKSIQTRIYLLGLLASYQSILQERMPGAMLTPLQYDLLKFQILYSTRISENLNNMMSNFEIGLFMMEDNAMETIILYLAHELAHQIYTINGFDAPLLSVASIHECSADIGARSIAQRLGFEMGLREYGHKIIQFDDYSKNNNVTETDLIGLGVPHKIGRTQLGYIIQGFKNRRLNLDWEMFFPVTLSVLRGKTKIKHLSFIRNIVAGYTYFNANRSSSHHVLQRFMRICENADTTTSREAKHQLANIRWVEEMIEIARTQMLRAVIP